jgi:hypothetical protein
MSFEEKEEIAKLHQEIIQCGRIQNNIEKMHNLQLEEYKKKLSSIGYPMKLFGSGSFFQPYIPLQQLDVLMQPEIKSFLVGTNNSILLGRKQFAIDAVVYVDKGEIELLNPSLQSSLVLSAPDRKFIGDIVENVESTYLPKSKCHSNLVHASQMEQIEFEGSDEDIRARFEKYLTQLLVSIEYEQIDQSLNPGASKHILMKKESTISVHSTVFGLNN